MNVIKMQAHQSDCKVTASPSAALGSLVAASDGTFWAADYEQASGAQSHVYHFSAEGGLISTVKMPQLAGSSSYTPQVQTLIMVKETLWMADYSSGIIYRYDTRNASAENTVEMVYISPTPTPRVQFWGLAYQITSIDTGLIWVNEVNSGTLFALNAASPAIASASQNPAKLVTLNITAGSAKSPRDMIFDHQGFYLWMIVADENTPSASVVQRIPAMQSVAVKDIKTFPVAGALSLSPGETSLCIGTVSGEIYALDIDHLDAYPRLLATLPKGSKTQRAPVIDYLTQDAANYIWAVDTNEGGELYEITPEGQTVAQYTLNGAAHSVIPGCILWSDKNDTLYIADMLSNGRVIAVTPFSTIDRRGKATYTLSAKPSHGTTDAGKPFAPFTLTVASTRSSFGLPTRVVLSVHDSPEAGAEFPLVGKQLNVSVPATGYPAAMLIAGPHAGNITVYARGRGLADEVIYTGSIREGVNNLSITGLPKQRTVPHGLFDLTASRVILTPDDPIREIALKIDSATDAQFANGRQVSLVHSGQPIPNIHAGKKAGNVIVTAETGGKHQSITLQVVPYPVKMNPPDWGTIHRIGFHRKLEEGAFTLYGHATDDDTSSPLIPVAGAELTLHLEDSGHVEFLGGATRFKAVLITNERGIASMRTAKVSIKLPDNVTRFAITCSASVGQHDPQHPALQTQVYVNISA